MLPLLVVQVLAALGLAVFLVTFVLRVRRHVGSRGPVPVVATNPPARGTQTLWVGGTVVTAFWGVGVLLVPTYAYHWPAFPDFPGSWVVQLFGIGLAAVGGALASRAALALGRQMTPVIRVQQDHQLRQTGPYRYIRHPVYTAIMVGALGQTLFFLSGPLLLVTLLLVGLAYYRARLEEQLLASPQGFGAVYAAYIARTGRFLPAVRRPNPP